VYLLVDPGFYLLPLNLLNLFFQLNHCGLFPHRMDARDRHNGQRDKRTNVRPSVRPSLRWSLTLNGDNVKPWTDDTYSRSNATNHACAICQL